MLKNSKSAIKWYFKGLFPIKLLLMLIVLILIFELVLYVYYKELPDVRDKINVLWSLTILISVLFNPPILASGVAHIARTRDMTIFEVSLIGSWTSTAIAKVIAIMIYILPYILLQYVILYLFIVEQNVIGFELGVLVILSLLLYCGLAILLTLSGSRVVAVLGSIMLSFLLPLSALITISTLSIYKITHINTMFSILLFTLNPLTAYVASYIYGLDLVNWELGAIVILAVFFIMLCFYVYAFSKKIEIKI